MQKQEGPRQRRQPAGQIQKPENVATTSLTDNLNGNQFQVGQAFNPFGLFHGLFIPEALGRHESISPGAKLAYGRLVRYAGKDGSCFPCVNTLSREIGVRKRQAQKYLAELETHRFIRREPNSGKASNFVFLWHAVFVGPMHDRARVPMHDNAPPPVHDRAPIRESIEESHLKESHPPLQSPPRAPCASVHEKRRRRNPPPSELLEEVRAAYPANRWDGGKAREAYEQKITSAAEHQKLLEGLNRHKQSERWADQEGRWIPFASNFIAKGQYLDEPPAKLVLAAAAIRKPPGKRDVISKMREQARVAASGGA